MSGLESSKRYKTAPRVTPPTEPLAPKQAVDDDPVTTKLNNLTTKEHSQGLHDLHGIADLPEETPELMQEKLEEMNEILSSSFIDLAADASAYRKAVAANHDYVDRLKAPCLRSMSYNSRQAAALVLRFFRQKLLLFGEEKLVKDIRLSDLSKEDRDCLNSGARQILPHRDRAGRAVVLGWGAKAQEFDLEHVMRGVFYLVMTIIERDVEDQKRGLVLMHYGFGQKSMPFERIKRYQLFWYALPWRIVGGHICIPPQGNTILDRAFRGMQSNLRPNWLVRTRIHSGSELECMYKLMTFGIIREAIKRTSDGQFDLTHHRKMLESLEYQEKQDERSESEAPDSSQGDEVVAVKAPLVLGSMDILLGRGRRPNGSRGTWLMYELVREHQEEYLSLKKTEKTKLSESILEKLKTRGCRFLKVSPSGYEECSDGEARAKIAHSFRNDKSRNQSSGRAPNSNRRQREA